MNQTCGTGLYKLQTDADRLARCSRPDLVAVFVVLEATVVVHEAIHLLNLFVLQLSLITAPTTHTGWAKK